MKIVTITLATLLFSFSTAQASRDSDYSAEVGVRAIVRTVISKNLVDKQAKLLLTSSLESPAQGPKLGKMICDRQLGKDACAIPVIVSDDPTTDEAEETLYQLEVHVFEGTVTSANFSLIAG